MENVFNFFRKLFGIVITFLTNTGVVWVGGIAGISGVLIFMPKNWFWGVVLGVLAGLFVMKNLEWIRPWANKQWEDIANKF